MTTKSNEGGSRDVNDIITEGEAARKTGSPVPDESASQCGSIDQLSTPRSPISSENQSRISTSTSAESTISGSTGLSVRLGSVPSSGRSRDSQMTSSNASLTDKTITATIELLKLGCLAGDNLPLKISIKHTKAIKSLHGVIITLYRQGRIDSAPPLSLFSDISDINGKEAEKLKHEEYYPKSKTGLGGLSLSSAGSSSLFRKDLAQTFAPILVDPSSLTAVIHASVRVPEDVFPTISGIPGQMIDFKYHVEVVLDLGGKLAGQQRHIPRSGAVQLPFNFINSSAPQRDGKNVLAAWGGSIVDTDHVRREKGVVACLFEVIVGTTDSARKRGRGNSSGQRINDWTEDTPMNPAVTYQPIYEETARPNGYEANYDDQQHFQYYDEAYDDLNTNNYDEGFDYQEHYRNQHPPPAHTDISVPRPEIQTESGLNEKERVRLAEERLLPSRPPGEPSSPTVIPSSAPAAPLDEPEEDLYGSDHPAPQVNFNPIGPLRHTTSAETLTGPSAPALGDFGPSLTSQPTEDKQELERRRLMAEASAPREFITDEEDNGGEAGSPIHLEPSAPTVSEHDEYGGRCSQPEVSAPSRDGTLPQYER